LVGLACAATLGACVGASSEVGSMDGDGGQGNECEAGATKPADDGCNTCTCDDEGNWGCTELACGVCTDGATRPAGDGCNDCLCQGGEWLCTQRMCAAPCTVGDKTDDGCTQCTCVGTADGPKWGCTLNVCNECTPGEMKIAEDGCNSCACGDDNMWSCTDLACPTCMDGDVKAAGDGCNTCNCVDGAWQCTRSACECMAGEMRPAGDGCNTCMCYDGVWGCTMALCNPPVCTDGMADCNGDPADGCETNIQTDVMNCGTCGNYCAMAGATSACVAGSCVLDSCDGPYADCNGDPADGCEARVGAGGCENRCNVPTMVVDPEPAQGTCECPAGTVCVRGSLEDEDPASEYCYPIPEGCGDSLASCGCMAGCVCPEKAQTTCYDQMAPGGVFIVNCAGFPATM
jgi:hypothetical protein